MATVYRKGGKGQIILKLNQALVQAGYLEGADDIFDEVTEGAVKAFQQDKGLRVDGLVGKNTWGALFPGEPFPLAPEPERIHTPARFEPVTMPPGLPPWVVQALLDLLKGVKEIPGPVDNPDIVAMHQDTSLAAQDDETPWCASAMNAWLKRAGLKGTFSAAAASFLTWGVRVPDGKQRLGCIPVLGRTGGNHVGVYLDEDANYVYMVGGNQDNQVSVRRYSFDRIRDIRFPADYPKYW